MAVDPILVTMTERYGHAAGPELTLIAELEALAEAEGLSGRAFGLALGVNQSAWSRVRRGQERFGIKTCTRIVQRYPHLRPIVARYLVASYGRASLTLLEEASRIARTTDQRP